jgi:hypothetical protein
LISANAPFCAFDRCVILSEYGRPPLRDERLARVLAYSAEDPPSIWALKARALAACGSTDEAWAALRAVESAALSRLPCDRDYLGTLGHLTRTALSLGALDYAAVLYTLLSPFPEQFAGHVDFYCEGSVEQLLGMLASALGQTSAALTHLEAGLALNERFGLAARSAETRLQLAQGLSEAASPRQRTRALALAREAKASADQLGMRHLSEAAAAWLHGAGG